MSSEYQREYLVRLPLPLAQLYDRAHNAKDARARYENTFYLFEALIKLAAVPAIACYLHEVGQGATRSKVLDRVLSQLALPSLGQWVGMLRELARHFDQLPDASSHPLGHLWDQLDKARRDRPALLSLYRRIKHGADGEPAGDQNCSLLQIFDALVQYRNEVIGHGGPRFDSFFTEDMGPLLFPAANEILAEATFDPLGPLGSRLVYVNAELRQLDEDRVEVGLRELIGKDGERAAPIPMDRSEAAALAGRVAVVWPGRAVPLRLDPLLLYREGERSSDMLFLNRDLNGRQIQYLNYSTGRTERDRSTAPALAALLSRITGREVIEAQLEAFAEQSRAATPSVESLFGPTEPVSRVLGGYEILAEIGRGGMGVVFLARQISLGRLVALKMLPADLAGDEVALARFRRELRLLARCEHSNIVMILDSGTMPDGQLYYAMEYIPGCNLDQVWRELSGSDHPADASTLSGSSWNQAVHSASRKAREQATRRPQSASADATSPEPPVLPLPPLPDLPSVPDDPGGYTRRVAMLVRDVARALQAIHDQDIVHRDVKPANLMLTPDGSRVVLMDFGLAKGQTLDALSKGTAGLLGTLRYAAPEQLAAARLKVGPTADVRGLGVVLWELLTRRRLFAEADDEASLTERIFHQEVPALRTIDPSFGRDLEAIVSRATERRSADRIATAGQLAEYLQLFLDGKPLPIRPPTTAEMVGRWIHERKGLVASAAFAGVIVLVTILTAFVMISASRDVAVDNAKKANALAIANGELAIKEKAATLEALERLTYAEHSSYNMQFAGVRELLGQNSISAARILDDEKAFPKNLRDFTWGYYSRIAPRIRATMPTLRHEALAVGFSYDGNLVATGGGDSLVKIWRIGSLGPENVLQGHKDKVTSVVFSPDGKFLASASLDGTARLWVTERSIVVNLKTTILEGHKGSVYSVAFSPEGSLLASAGADGSVRLWEPETGRTRLALTGHTAPVKALAFAPDGRSLASAGDDGTVRIWETETGRERSRLSGHRVSIASVAFSPDGQTLASGDIGGGIRTWDTVTGLCRANLAQENNTITMVGFLPENGALISVTKEGKIALWDQATSRSTRVFWGYDHESILGFAVSGDGHMLATSGPEGNVALRDTQQGELIHVIYSGHSPSIEAFKISPEEGALALELSDGTIELRELTGKRRELFVRPDGRPWGWHVVRFDATILKGRNTSSIWELEASRFSPDGRTLLTTDNKTMVQFWEVATGRLRSTFRIDGLGIERFVSAAEFAPDSRTFVVADECKRMAKVIGNVVLWDIMTGQERVISAAHPGVIETLAFAPDGRIIATTGDDGTLRLWDVATLQRREVFNLPKEKIDTLAVSPREIGPLVFSPDGSTLALGVGSTNGVVILWDVPSARERTVLRGHTNRIQSLVFTPDSRTLASLDGSRTVRLWDTAAGQERAAIENELEWFDVIGFAMGGHRLILRDKGGSVHLYNLETNDPAKPIAYLHGTRYGITHANFVISPDGRMLAGYDGSNTRVWDVATGELLNQYPEIGSQGVAFTPDNRTVVSAGRDEIYLLDPVKSPERSTLKGHSKSPNCVAFSPDGRLIASAGYDWTIRIWDARNRTEIATLAGPEGDIYSLAFSPDGRTLASWGKDRKIRLWNLETGWERTSLIGHEAGGFILIYTRDGKTLVSSDEHEIILWDLAASRPRATIRGHDGKILGIALSTDDRTLATTGLDRTIRLWDMATGLERKMLVKLDGWAEGLVFSPDGQTLAGNVQRGIQIWDTSTGRERAIIRAQGSIFHRLAFSPDGRTLATTGARDGAVRLWDPTTGQERASMPLFGERPENIWALAFSPDGRTLASAGVDNDVTLWDASELLPVVSAPVEAIHPIMISDPVRDRYYRALLTKLARKRGVASKLSEPLGFNFAADTPLSDLLKYIRDATQDEAAGLPTGLMIYVDSVSLQKADITLADTFLLALERIPLGAGLKAALSQLGLTYRLDDVVLVITKEGLNRTPPALPEIRTSDRTTQALLFELEEAMPISFPEFTRLGEVLQFIRTRTKTSRFPDGLPIEFEPRVLAEEPKIESSEVLLDLNEAPLRLTLSYLLDQRGLTYGISGGRILISFASKKEAK